MVYMRSSACLLIVVVICITSSSCTNAFVGHRNRACLRRDKTIQRNIIYEKRIPSISISHATLFANNKDDQNDNRQSTKIDGDGGSPIGVAIVLCALLGNIYFPGSLSTINYFFPGIENNEWIFVLAAASIAAGLSRLLRYLKDKNDKE